MGRSDFDLVDVECEVRRETERAIGIADGTEDEHGREVLTWLPKQYCEVNDDGTVTMPEWLAEDRGLV